MSTTVTAIIADGSEIPCDAISPTPISGTPNDVVAVSRCSRSNTRGNAAAPSAEHTITAMPAKTSTQAITTYPPAAG